MKKFFVFILIVLSFSMLKAQVTQDPNDEIIWQLKPPGDIWQVAFHPNNKYVFSFNDGVIQMYDVETATLVREFGRGVLIDPLGFNLSKDNSMLAVRSAYYYPLKTNIGKITIFDIETGKEINSFIDSTSSDPPKYYNSVSFSPDGTKIVTTGRNFNDDNNAVSMVRIIDIKTNSYNDIGFTIYDKADPNFPKSKYINYTNAIFSPDGKSIYAISSNVCQVKKFDSLGFKRRTVILDKGYVPSSIDFGGSMYLSKSNKYLLINAITSLNILDLETNQFRNDLIKKHGLLGNNNSDEKGIYVGNNLGTFDIVGNNEIYTYKFGKAAGANLSKNDSLIVTLSNYDTLRLIKAKWNATTDVEDTPQIKNFNILSISPNPAINFININLISNFSNIVKIEVLEITGQEVLKQERNITIGINNINLPLNNISNGTYLLRLTLNNSSKQMNFIIKK